MVLLFFALDLRSLSPPLLEEVKQCLLKLANFYAVSAPELKRRKSDYVVEDRIGLCYLQRSENSPSNELKIAYSPRGRNFSLRDFHYAVKHLPSDAHLPPFDFGSSVFHDVDFSSVLSDEVLDSAGNRDIERKIILISSCLVWNMESRARKTLLDAADRCVSMEFVFLEQKSSQLSDLSENINIFREQIYDLENCSFNAYLPDACIFNGLVKRWLRELNDSKEELSEALFVFQKTIVGSTNQISCKLCNSKNHIMDGFSPRRENTDDGANKFTVTKPDLEIGVVDVDSMEFSKHISMVEESWWSWTNLREVSSVVHFNITERTSLPTLNEAVLVGRPYIVIPSMGRDLDAAPEESDKSQTNDQLFHGLCRALYSLNQGLVCWSLCNIDTMKETAFYHYYILQPSDNGPMLLRRLATAEEILPLPDAYPNDSSANEEIDNSIQLCLREVELRDYNPVQHIAGFHERINQLIQESLESGEFTSRATTTESDSFTHETTDVSKHHNKETESEAHQGATHPPPKGQVDEAEKGISHLTQEWEQLIVSNVSSIDPMIAGPILEKPKTSPLASQRPLESRTLKILERLGNPKQMKTKATTSPTLVSNGIASSSNSDGKTKNRPMIVDDQGVVTTSQLMKPIFQRLKRKLR